MLWHNISYVKAFQFLIPILQWMQVLDFIWRGGITSYSSVAVFYLLIQYSELHHIHLLSLLKPELGKEMPHHLNTPFSLRIKIMCKRFREAVGGGSWQESCLWGSKRPFPKCILCVIEELCFLWYCVQNKHMIMSLHYRVTLNSTSRHSTARYFEAVVDFLLQIKPEITIQINEGKKK